MSTNKKNVCLEGERYVIGALFRGGDFALVADLTPGHFTLEGFPTIWAEIQAINRMNPWVSTLDRATLLMERLAYPMNEMVAEIVAAEVSSANLETYASVLREAFHVRRTQELARAGDLDGLRALLTPTPPQAAPLNLETPSGNGPGANPYRGTDDGNADLFLALHGKRVRFCPPWDQWLLWSGSHWQPDDCMDMDRLAASVPRKLYQVAAELEDSHPRKSLVDLARKLEGIPKRSTMLAASRHRVAIRHTDLDQDRFLLNTRNGTVNLRTGQRYRHRPEDLITHAVDIPYEPTALAPTWMLFLNRVFSGDTDLIQFVQRAVGYSMTGDVREQVLLICHGSGSNGKSVFLNIVRKLLGKLALQAAPDLLMADKGQRRHPTEQADLFSKRIVVCQETEKGRRFNEALVKQLTGGDAIRARRMHEDFWEFEPTHKLWLSTNHKPEILGTDYAIWRRIRLIPFNVQFTDDGEPRKDPAMESKLSAELPGILAWGIQGCLDWQRDGLRPPQAVKVATQAYREEMDVLAAFLAECCVEHRRAEVTAAALYAAYCEWCARSNEHPEKQRKFGTSLTERGIQRKHYETGWSYVGIGLMARNLTELTELTDVSDNVLRDSNSLRKIRKEGSVPSVPSATPDPEALASALLNGCKGLNGLEVRTRLGWNEDRFSTAKNDLMAEGRIEFIGGGWHLKGEVQP